MSESEMTAEEYKLECERTEREHQQQLTKLEAQIRVNRQESVKSAARAALLETNCRADAIDDMASIVAGQARFDEAGKAFITNELDPTEPHSPESFARKLVSDRVYLRAPVDGAGRKVNTWDIQKAARDLAYNEKWKAADPEGHKAAWDEHLEALAAKR